MRYYPRLLLRCPFEIVEIAGEVTAVSVGGEQDGYNGVIQLQNETARFLFEKLQAGITLPELVKACMDRYGEPLEEVQPQVIDFLDRLKVNGLLAADLQHGVKMED